MSNILLLIVEDEALVALNLEEALTDAGYECVVAYNGKDGMAHLNDSADQFKGVLTDIRLGKGPDGWDIGHRAREIVPEMPIIYMSGDSAVDWTSKGVPNSLMIPKPYALAQVITAISQMINAAATVTATATATIMAKEKK